MTEGAGVFTTPDPLRPRHLRTRTPCLRPRGFRSRAWACSTRGARCVETSDTPVAIPSSSSRSRTFVRARSAYLSLWFRRPHTGRKRRKPPRSPATPSRESRRPSMTRGAFHRQGPFVGSGGLYSPGPATAAPLLAMLPPLDDALTSPWAFSRSCSVVVRSNSSRDSPFRPMHPPTCDRRRLHRPRPPFTRP